MERVAYGKLASWTIKKSITLKTHYVCMVKIFFILVLSQLGDLKINQYIHMYI